jgi:hypothetical protein
MSPSILFLATSSHTPDDNATRLPRSFETAGWEVCIQPHDALQVRFGEIWVGGHAASHFDLIWPIGFGNRRSFLDRAQLLADLPQLITPMRALLELHGKAAWLEHCAPSVVAASADSLCSIVRQQGGRWVLKPSAASFGEGVTLIEHAHQIAPHMAQRPGYWILQRYLPAIVEGETRTLVCGNAILGSYRRIPLPGKLTANLATSARAEKVTLSAEDSELVARIQQRLQQSAVGYAAIDVCGGVLMEVNIANPGGLSTLDRLYNQDHGAALVAAVRDLMASRQF